MQVYDYYKSILKGLSETGNLRKIPDENSDGIIDLSSNDYLGIAEDSHFVDNFLENIDITTSLFTSSASRLLGSRQKAYEQLENTLNKLYGRSSILFNSGYHANVGIVQALSDKRTIVIADKLIHASIIDGMKLAGNRFDRFRHNDVKHLERLLQKYNNEYERLIVIVESVYSMDGDCAPLDLLVDLKKRWQKVMLYVDEAHAIGVCGQAGLGYVSSLPNPEYVDIVVGTFGKALASSGAYAICSETLRTYFINKARSLIFSTALPPLQALWSKYVIEAIAGMDSRRDHLKKLGRILAKSTGCGHCGHIQPLICGSAETAIDFSSNLVMSGFKVLPIRTPTVPVGTERLRFSLSSAVSRDSIEKLSSILSKFVESE